MVDNKTSGKIKLIFKIVFFCVFAFSLLVGIYLTSLVKDKTENEGSVIDYIENWTVIDDAGNSIKTGRTYNDDRAYKEDFTIVTKLPDKIGIDCVLCFQNRSSVDVYINGVIRKSFDRIRDTGIPGGSIKEFYITIPLSPSDAGAELEMIRYKTDWNPVVVPETFVTHTDGVYDYMASKYGISFLFTVILFVASLLTAIVAFVMHIWIRQKINMFFGALGILDVACWMLSVSQVTPMLTGIYYVDGVMGFFFCMMMPFSLLIYLNSIQRERYKILYNILFILSLCNFVFWTIMHFTGVINFQSSLIYIDSILAVVVISVIVTLFIDMKKGHIKEYIHTAIGFMIFMVMCIVEIMIIIFSENDSNLMSMIIALMSLLVLVAIQQVDDIRKTKRELEAEVNRKKEENEQMLIHIVQTLAGTIDAKDTYTKGHSGRVADYAKEIARRCGYDEAGLNDIYMMGLLHDIGKIGVPDAVINKPGKLTDEEYEIIKKHPVMGAKILENIKEKTQLAVGARWHHEKYGGGGYPDGISGDEIPEQARIIAVADAYDAMTSYRSYRDPMAQSRVREEIERGKGTQFDPRFADIMLEMISEDKDYSLREKRQ